MGLVASRLPEPSPPIPPLQAQHIYASLTALLACNLIFGMVLCGCSMGLPYGFDLAHAFLTLICGGFTYKFSLRLGVPRQHHALVNAQLGLSVLTAILQLANFAIAMTWVSRDCPGSSFNYYDRDYNLSRRTWCYSGYPDDANWYYFVHLIFGAVITVVWFAQMVVLSVNCDLMMKKCFLFRGDYVLESVPPQQMGSTPLWSPTGRDVQIVQLANGQQAMLVPIPGEPQQQQQNYHRLQQQQPAQNFTYIPQQQETSPFAFPQPALA